MTTRPSVLVHFDHGREPKHPIDPVTRPDSFPYGYGYGAEYLRLSLSRSVAEGRAVRFVRRGLLFTLGFDVVHAFRNRRAMIAADVIITHTEHEHLAVALLKRVGLVGDTRLIGQSIWLWDHWEHLNPVKRLLYRSLLREVDVHTVHSPVNSAFGTDQLDTAVYLVPYGAHVLADESDFSYTPPPVSETVDVVAPGSDRHRDWRTLIDAARRDPTLRVTIVSRRLRPRLLARRCPERVTVRSARSFDEVQQVMREHAVVAVPLKRNRHVSGLTVLFEGLLARRPIAITRAGGSDYYGRDHVDWAAPGDPDALAAAIHAAHARRHDPAGLDLGWRSVAERGLTLRDYGLRHVLAVWIALGFDVDPALLSVDEPIEPLVREHAARLQSDATAPAPEGD